MTRSHQLLRRKRLSQHIRSLSRTEQNNKTAEQSRQSIQNAHCQREANEHPPPHCGRFIATTLYHASHAAVHIPPPFGPRQRSARGHGSCSACSPFLHKQNTRFASETARLELFLLLHGCTVVRTHAHAADVATASCTHRERKNLEMRDACRCTGRLCVVETSDFFAPNCRSYDLRR